MPAIDYRLTDPHLDPPGTDGDYAERSVRLPQTFWCYDAEAMGVAHLPPPGDPPAVDNGFITFGCLNNFAKTNAAELLEKELAAPGYEAKTMAMGTNTDPYQPIERDRKITRAVLEVLARADHPVGIVTKSALVLRDLDILAPMARKGLVKVAMSITTLDPDLARKMEPRASAPARRLAAIEEMSKAGVPATVMVAPVIPAINDHEIETILTRAAALGAREAGYVMLRLPLELRDLFEEWLAVHFPDKLRHVMTLVASMRKGKAYDSTWGERQTGTGPFAWMIGRRFEAAAARNGYASERMKLRTDLFRRPVLKGEQLSLL